MNNINSYKLVKESKTGNIVKKKLIMGGAISMVGGMICLFSILPGKAQNISYDSSYATYSQQLEEMLNVDMAPDLEEEVNKLQDISTMISDYQKSDAVIQKSDASKKLINEYEEIYKTSLDILKLNIAHENNCSSENLKVSYEPSDGSWVASSDDLGAITLTGKQREIAENIGNLQSCSIKNMETFNEKQMDNYVDLCSDTISQAINIAVSQSPKSK